MGGKRKNDDLYVSFGNGETQNDAGRPAGMDKIERSVAQLAAQHSGHTADGG